MAHHVCTVTSDNCYQENLKFSAHQKETGRHVWQKISRHSGYWIKTQNYALSPIKIVQSNDKTVNQKEVSILNILKN